MYLKYQLFIQASITYNRTDKPMVQVPKLAREKILWTRGIFCCPHLFPRSILLYYEEHIPHIYTSIYINNSVAQEPEGSSPHSQQPATGPCPKPVESNPHPRSQSP
jgi:hypothetical protein